MTPGGFGPPGFFGEPQRTDGYKKGAAVSSAFQISLIRVHPR